MYDHSLHSCHYCLQAFSTEKILKRYVKGWLKINGKQKLPKKTEYAKFKNYERKIKPSFIIHSYFKKMLVSEDNSLVICLKHT